MDKSIELIKFMQKNCFGKRNAMTSKKLSLKFGCTERALRQIILVCRQNGEPILSSVHEPWGFYLPENEAEGRECLNQFYSRIQEIYKTTLSIERGINQRFSTKLPL